MSELFDLEFLRILRQKLKTGNRRSIHLNVLPGRYATRLELGDLNDIEENLAESFIDVLLSKSKFRFDISLGQIDPNCQTKEKKQKLGLVSKRLNSIIYENNDNYLEHGIKTFGMGYPILVKRDRADSSKMVKAPLLIWSLDIKRSRTEANKWSIIRENDFPISINGVLKSHLEADEGLRIERLSDELLEDSKIDKGELLKIVTTVLGQLKSGNPNDLNRFFEQQFNAPIEKIAERDSIESSTTNPWVIWSGVFGLYRTQKESIIKDLDTLIERFETFSKGELRVEKYQTTSIASVETDPSQQEILNSLSYYPNKIIQGPPGTGKSQSLTALLSNALANKARCLVVCEKRTALDVIYKNLQEAGLNELAVIIEDTSKDRKKAVDSVRSRLEGGLFLHFSEDHNYRMLLENINRGISEIQEGHRKLAQALFGDDKWTALVGKFIALDKECQDNPLIESLDRNLFEFTDVEFNRISRVLDEAQSRYGGLKSLKHPLEFVRDDVFEEENPNTVRTQIESVLDRLENENGYSEATFNEIFKNEGLNYLGFVENSVLKAFSITSSIGDRLARYRSEGNFLIQSFRPMTMKVLKLLSGIRLRRFQQAYDDKAWIVTEYNKLAQFFERHKMRYDFIDVTKKFTLSDLDRNIDILLRSYVKHVKNHLKDFRSFYQWKHFYLRLDELQKSTLIALIIGNVSDWKSHFQHWYYSCILEKNEDSRLPSSDMRINSLAQDLDRIKNCQIKHTLRTWKTRQTKAVERFHSKNTLLTVKNLYNKRGSKGQKRNSLRKIVHADLELFTSFFPILLINPSVCSSLLPLRKGIFDLVVFDEASQLTLEHTFAALLRGKHKVVSGDSHQMPPSRNFQGALITLDGADDEDFEDREKDHSDRRNRDGLRNLAYCESLLEFAENAGYRESLLKIHYRSKHPYLIDFSNAAFYGKRLNPMPPKYDYKPIHFIEVNGTYKNHINEREAEQVLKLLLNEIKPKKDGGYPSVGVATFNVSQRNFILERINEQQQESMDNWRKLQKLFDAGLFVKNLENIQGDERDIMILSVTFGRQENGVFSQNFGPINRINGYRLLNVIITRAKEEVYVCSSIPPQYYDQYRELIPLKGNTGRQILYAYLVYAKAIQNKDEETRSSIIDLLFEYCPQSNYGTDIPASDTESPFEDEVYSYLSKHIDPRRIEVQYSCAGFRIDMIVKSKLDNRPRIAIECDGASYHSSNEAYAWDVFRQKHLERYGFKFIRIWSTNWWHDPNEETKKLVEFINCFDSAELQKTRTGPHDYTMDRVSADLSTELEDVAA